MRISRWHAGAPKKGADETYCLEVTFEESARGTQRRVKLPDGKRLNVKIPAGVKSGQQIRLRGQGQPGMAGGEAGDALIERITHEQSVEGACVLQAAQHDPRLLDGVGSIGEGHCARC